MNDANLEQASTGLRCDAGNMTWIFGYGSLMWNPGFAFEERQKACLRGYRRAYVMVSTRNRGTPECPGLALSLTLGGDCIGAAFRVAPEYLSEALAYLDKREGESRANRRVVMPLSMENGGAPTVQPAFAYLPMLSYSNYVCGVPENRQVELVARASGKTGSSYDYLRQLMEELQGLEVREPELENLFRRVTRHREPPMDSATSAPTAFTAATDRKP